MKRVKLFIYGCVPLLHELFKGCFLTQVSFYIQVRHAQISECGVETKVLAKHEGRVHKLAIEPGSPHILYTCGEDGLVHHVS